MNVGKVVIDTRRLDQIAAKLGKNTEQAIRIIAIQIEGVAKIHAPIDTGALMNSIYTVTTEHDGYPPAAAEARKNNPKVNLVRHPRPPQYTAFVGPCVEYGIYQEFGTYKMAAHPYLTPAAEQVSKQIGAIFQRELLK